MARRSGVDDVLAPWQFEELLRTAASIADPVLATEFAYLLYAPCRIGPRNSTVLHGGGPFHVRNRAGKIVAYQIPTALPSCGHGCNICENLVDRRVDESEHENPDVVKDGLLGDYWKPKSHAGGRKIPILQERGREILTLYEHYHGHRPNMTSQTYRNRLTRLEEICDKVDVNLYPQAGRATCTNYWAMWGLNAKHLRWLMGWKYISTAQYYLRKSDVVLRWKMEEALGLEPTVPYEIYREPPTFTEMRKAIPVTERISDLQLTPESQTQAPPEPDEEDPLEEIAQEEMEDSTFDRFTDEDRGSAGQDPLIARTALRLWREVDSIIDNGGIVTPQRISAVIGVSTCMLMLLWAIGGQFEAMAAGELGTSIGGVLGVLFSALWLPWAVHEDFDDGTVESRFDELVVRYHAAVDPVFRPYTEFVDRTLGPR